MRAGLAQAAAVLGFLGFTGLGASLDEPLLFVGAAAVAVTVGLYSASIRCPACGRRIYDRQTRVFGVTVRYQGDFLPPESCACSRCLRKWWRSPRV
jgi:hypothetical protein